MFTLFNKIENIVYYTINEKHLILKDNHLNFILNNQIVAQNIADDLILTNDKVFYNKLERVNIYNLKNDALNYIDGFSIINTKPMSNQIGVIIRNEDEQLFLFDKIKLEKTKLNIENYNWGLIFCSDEHLFIQDNSSIKSFSIKQNKFLWHFDLNQFGTYANRDNVEENYRVIKILGIWQDQVFVACSNGLIITLDMHSGQPVRQWQYIDNYYFDDDIKNRIPRAESFVFDGDFLLGALNRFVYKINLKTSEITVNNIEDELKKYNIFHIKTVNDNPVTNEHIFLTVMMHQKENDTKFSYDSLIALNKNTLKIDWHYPFENAGLGTNIPKLAGNKLYQLDNNSTLHIFKKNQNESV